MVGSIAGIREQTNQDSQLKNKVLRPLPAVRELPPRYELRVTAGRVPSRGIVFSTRDRVCANHLTACEIIRFVLGNLDGKSGIPSDMKLLINNI